MTAIDYEAEYNNRQRVPEHVEINARWQAASAAYRAVARAELDRPYGPGERHRYDLYYAADPNAPLVVYIHGGYWQRGGREDYAWLAQALVAQRAIELERLFGPLAGEVMCEHVGQPLGRGQMRRVHRRAQQPESRFAGRGRGGLEPILPRAQRNQHAARAHQCRHVVEVLGEVLDVAIIAGAAQRV